MLTNERVQQLIAADRDGLIELLKLWDQYRFGSCTPQVIDLHTMMLFEAVDVEPTTELENLLRKIDELQTEKDELAEQYADLKTTVRDFLSLRLSLEKE